jgi:transcriptional regulator with XRE-family HTH domain
MLKEALRLVRVFHDLNKSEVASRVGLSKSYISELENGDKKVSLEVLEKYATAFNIPMSSLMLFAEQTAAGKHVDKSQALVADKTVKMLDWIATITADDNETEDARS